MDLDLSAVHHLQPLQLQVRPATPGIQDPQGWLTHQWKIWSPKRWPFTKNSVFVWCKNFFGISKWILVVSCCSLPPYINSLTWFDLFRLRLINGFHHVSPSFPTELGYVWRQEALQRAANGTERSESHSASIPQDIPRVGKVTCRYGVMRSKKNTQTWDQHGIYQSYIYIYIPTNNHIQSYANRWDWINPEE